MLARLGIMLRYAKTHPELSVKNDRSINLDESCGIEYTLTGNMCPRVNCSLMIQLNVLRNLRIGQAN